MPVASATAPAPRIVQLPMEWRDAEIVNVDADSRTMEVIWTTGAAVRRRDWWTGEEFDEVLEVSARAVDLSRLNNGAPLLESHNAWSLRGVLGVVEKAWLSNGEGRARVRFTSAGIDEETDKIYRKVQDRVLQKISTGYFTRQVEWDRTTTPPTRRAVKWQPFEISFVGVAADDGAGRRAASQTMYACEIIDRAARPATQSTTRRSPMPENTEITSPENDAERARLAAQAARIDARRAEDAAAVEARVQEAARAERIRAKKIRDRVRAVRLPEELADELIDCNASDSAVERRLTDELAEQGPTVTMPARIIEDHNDPAALINRMSDGLALRGLMNLPKTVRDEHFDARRQAAARPFMSGGIMALLCELATARGMHVDYKQPRAVMWDTLVEMRSLSTSDFPLLLANAANKILLPAYQFAQPTFFRIAQQKTFNDFRAHKFLRTGDFPDLLVKGETGEFKAGKLSESSQDITALEYGRIITVSRQIIINDDQSAFSDLPRMAGIRAAAVANKLGFNLFALNSAGGPTITEPNAAGVQTGVAMWNAAHNNLTGTGTAIDDTSIGVGVGMMLAQLSMDGIPVNPMARYIMAAPAKIGLLRKFTAVLTSASSAANQNPWGGLLEPLTDGNLTGNAWYLFSDPQLGFPCFVYGYLSGQEGPRIATQEGFTSEGVNLRCAMDFGCGGIDFRGTYKNNGA